MHHAIMQHAHRVCAAGPATPCSGVNKTYRKLTLGKAAKQISDGRLAAAAMAVAKQPEGHCWRAKRAVLQCNTARLAAPKGMFHGSKTAVGAAFPACFGVFFRPNGSRMRHLRSATAYGSTICGKCSEDGAFTAVGRPTAAGAALEGAVVNIVRRF